VLFCRSVSFKLKAYSRKILFLKKLIYACSPFVSNCGRNKYYFDSTTAALFHPALTSHHVQYVQTGFSNTGGSRTEEKGSA